MIGGHIIIDGMGYSIVEGTVPEVDGAGQPTGRLTPIKSLIVKDNACGLVVELRMLPTQFDEFAAAVSGRKLVVPSNGRLPIQP